MSEVLEERMKALEARLTTVESELAQTRKTNVELLVELKVLQTRVSVYAGLVAAAVSVGLKFLG